MRGDGKVKVIANRSSGVWWVFGTLAALFTVALYLGFIVSPPDELLGDTVRIFYLHVSLAWVAMIAFTVNFVGSIGYLARRNLAIDRWAAVSAEIGTVFTTATIVTGSIWARAAWGVWWTWDPRLTTALIMWFVYVAYLMVRSNLADPGQRAQISAVIGVIIFFDVPLVFMSVRMWRTIHPVVVGSDGTFRMAPTMLASMFAMLAAVSVLYVVLMNIRIRLTRMQDEIHRLQLEIEN